MTDPASASALLDRLRSEPHKASEYVVPLAAMLYLRWADFQEAEAEAMAAFDESEFTPVLPASLHWRCWHDFLPDELKRFFAQNLPDAIERLAASGNPLAAALRRLLPAIRSCGEISPRALMMQTQWLAVQTFETPNDRRRLLEVFDAIIEHADPRDSGQFRTPPCINDLLVDLAAPAPGERLYDPCFGFAGNLTAAFGRVSQTDSTGFVRSGVPALIVAGVEANAHAFAVGLARLTLAGVSDPQLELGNSLERDGASNPQKEGFDLVICNPPWGGRLDLRGLDHFPVPSSDSTGLFVQHALSQLRPGGRAVIVVPQGFLFQQGKLATLRRWLLENHRVDAVIPLPPGAFMPFTAINASILVLRRGAGPTQRIRMVEGAEFFEPARGRESGYILHARIEALAAAMRDATPGRHTWDVEAATLAELDYNLTPARRDKSMLEAILESLGKEIPVLPLKELCRVSTGAAINSSGLAKEPMGEQPVPYIRIGDIQRGQATKGKSWLTPETLAELGPRFRLRAGDVLVSRSGTIGKAGVVRNGAVGGVATSGLFVLSADDGRIDPHFLAAYLATGECREWLHGRAGGSVIRALPQRIIEELPVPVPPPGLQHRVAVDVREQGVDALTQLGILLSSAGDDPVAKWIDRSLKRLSEDSQGEGGDPLPVLMQIFKDFDASGASNPYLWPGYDSESKTGRWVSALGGVVFAFAGIEEVPRGPALLSLLQQASSLLGPLAREFEEVPGVRKEYELTVGCLSRLHAAMDSLLSDVDVTITIDTQRIVAGEPADVSFTVQSNGPLPLRRFWLKSEKWGFASQPIFFAEGRTEKFTVEIIAPSVIGQCPMPVVWRALHLAEHGFSISHELLFEVEVVAPSTSIPVAASPLGLSPYFHGPPVGPDRNDVFFGREDLMARIKAQIQSGNTVLLEGNRRSGKSSILKHLEGKDVIPGWLAVFADFQGVEGDKKAAGMPNEAIWRSLARSLASALTKLKVPLPLPDGTVLPPGSHLGISAGCRNGISKEAPWEDFLDYFQAILRLLGGLDLGLVLMIDEFDKLQEGIDNGVTSPQIPENIRFLIQSHPRFVAVLTGSRRMQRLRHEYWSALYGLGNRVGVTALDPESARQLITEPVKGKLSYTGEATDLIMNLTARQPFLIQYLCNRVFELVNHHGIRSVGKKLVAEAAESFVRDNEHFASLWDYAATDRRRFLIEICHRQSAGPDPVTFGLLQQQLATEGVEVSDTDLDNDLKFLRELELIDFTGTAGGGIYRLTVPLMGQWIDQQQEYAALRDKARKEQENSG